MRASRQNDRVKRFVVLLVVCLAATSAHGYRGEKITLDAPCIEVRRVLQIVANLTGLNIITSDTVGGSLTLRLKDVPWDQALDIVLEARGLSKRVNGNVVLIAPARELAGPPALPWPMPLETLRVESFPLAFANAGELRKRLADRERGILSRRGAASVDERTNTIFVQDTAEVLDTVARLVRRLDVAPPFPI